MMIKISAVRGRSKSLITMVLVASLVLAAKVASAVESEQGFLVPLEHSDDGQLLFKTAPTLSSSSSSSSLLRGGSTGPEASERKNKNGNGLEFPPIPPIHPVHTGQVHYSSSMDADGTILYRRDIEAPCDYGMLLFNIGPSNDNLPYLYDVYADAYLWSDNGSLCILYPTYTGYQVSDHGPFWRRGYDPTTIRFGDLVGGPRHMHRISSRILRPEEASRHSEQINKTKAGDYIIMGHYNFYGIDFYKALKEYVNDWGPNGPSESDDNEFGWMLSDATTESTETQ